MHPIIVTVRIVRGTEREGKRPDSGHLSWET
jgi:hypothetical protein